jgi:hypothetical protein
MAYDYGNDQWWGSEYKRALQNGDTAYANSLQAKMDTNPHPFNQQTANQNAQQVGMINAKTADMGRGTNVFANGGNGLEYNTVGQSRTPGQGAFNTMSGQHGYAVNPGAVQGSPVGGAFDPTPTMTAAQYGGAPQVGQRPQTFVGGQPYNDDTSQGGWAAQPGGLTQMLQQLMQQFRSGQAPAYNSSPQNLGPQQQYSQPWQMQQQPWQMQQPMMQQQYRPQQFNWGGGYGSGQSAAMSGPLSQMYWNGWGR